jgi:hypothetical protein
VWQVGASILHVPSGLWAYGLWQREDNNGTQWKELNFNKPTTVGNFTFHNSDANQTEVWFVKAGIKRTWTPLGATVLWGEGGQYQDMFNGLCGNPGSPTVFHEQFLNSGDFCLTSLPTGKFSKDGQNVTIPAFVTGSEVNRWGLGVMQEIDSAAMHVWANWQHLELNLDAVSACNQAIGGITFLCSPDQPNFGKKVKSSFQDLDMFMVGGVIFF